MKQRSLCLLFAVGLLVALPGVVPAATGSVQVVVSIDGLSELLLSGNTAQWYHLEYSPPGETVLNGVAWTPAGLSSFCNCYSDVFAGVVPAIPQTATDFAVTWTGRGPVTLEELPAAGNGYTLRVRFDDVAPGGADVYDALITYEYPDPVLAIPTLGVWGLIAFALLLAAWAVLSLRRRAVAS